MRLMLLKTKTKTKDMYYKIENKECKVYKELYALRIEEKDIERKNKEAVKNVCGCDWDSFLGHSGQQNLWRVTRYIGFAFKHSDRLPEKTWKRHKEYHDIYVPDTRTKNGKQMKKFLNELPHSSIFKVFDILRCQLGVRFAFPFVEIGKGGVIVLYIGDRYHDTLKRNKCFIEITSGEFDKLLEEVENENENEKSNENENENENIGGKKDA